MSYFEVLVRRLLSSMCILALCCSASSLAFGEASSASLSITVADTSGAVIPDATAALRNSDTNQQQTSLSNKSGNASFSFLKPGHYVLVLSKAGFSDVTVANILLNVGDEKHLQLVLKVGAATQNVTVDGSGQTINTTNASVSTIIDRQFVANIPLNGRSFQDLISITPGVVTESPQNAGTVPGSNGDFSINGQRTESNYYMVDGVSANVGAGPSSIPGYGAAGVMAATSALGTTQSLLSVDDLQEFRVESSSYSAEYGRSPGGQLTFITRSGTNGFHGSAYDYFRNGSLDANDWFNDHLGQPKQVLHQNDFGGTFGGPVWIPRLYRGEDKTFFFGSWESLRMTQPVAASIQYVPDTYLREQAPAAIQPLLNAFPLPSPNGTDYGTPQDPGLAQFYKGYSLPGDVDSGSIRVDQTFTPAFSAFFRFADTPSSVSTRYNSVLTSESMKTQTYTLGTTYVVSPSTTDQFRIGHSRSSSGSSSVMDSFGGATPTDLGKGMGNTTGITGQSARAELYLFIGAGYAFLDTPTTSAKQDQWNITDALDFARGTQHLKVGLDFRHMHTYQTVYPVEIYGEYDSTQSVLSDSADFAAYERYLPSTPVYNQLALFVQDDWRISRSLSLSGGLRWEVAPPPHNATTPQPYILSGNLSDPTTLTLAAAGTALWHTSWYNFAPRFGAAWQVNTTSDWATVVRAGGGVFFDTSNQVALPPFAAFGFSSLAYYYSVPLPLTAGQQETPISIAPPYSNVYAFPSHFQLPYTLEWNTAIEQQLGQNNAATISYVGAAGRRLNAVQDLSLSRFNSLLGTVLYMRGVTSDYDALQAQFQRNVSKGINALVAYTWSHSIDYGSNFESLPVTRGNSDFDVRHNFQGGLTWDLPHAHVARLLSGVLNGWGVNGRFLARSGFPITLRGRFIVDPTTGSEYYGNVDQVPNQPIYLSGEQYPGKRALNPAAFAYPSGTNAGNAPRNIARGFGESQINFAARRDFVLSEAVHLQFRAEAFNILNHPNFGYVDPVLTDATFGQATQMLNQSLGTVASQYQQGGPRSMQFALRLAF